MSETNKQLRIVSSDNSRLRTHEPNETVELFNEDGTPYSLPEASGSILRSFPFSFDTEDILTGASLYTPTVDDILLDAWIEVVEAWDGTDPKCDYGQFVDASNGLLGYLTGIPIDMTEAGLEDFFDSSLRTPGGDAVSTLSQAVLITNSTDLYVTQSVLPLRFLTDDPIKVCVSRDGTIEGDDPDSTQGSAILYLITATPVSD